MRRRGTRCDRPPAFRRARGDAIASAVATAIILTATMCPRPSLAAVEQRLWDETRQLTPADQSRVEKRLASAARRLGGPIVVVLLGRLHHESAPAAAARLFAEHGLGGGDPQSNPLLLLVSPSDGAAAIETGKGNAGIVPEIDAHAITNALLSARRGAGLGPSLGRAIDAMVVSAAATMARRRPSAVDEDLPAPDDAPAAATTSTTADAGDVTKPDGGVRGEGETPTDEAGSDPAIADDGGAGTATGGKAPAAGSRAKRSRVPIAAGVAGLVILALALRRRRSLSESRDKRPSPPRPPGPRPR